MVNFQKICATHWLVYACLKDSYEGSSGSYLLLGILVRVQTIAETRLCGIFAWPIPGYGTKKKEIFGFNQLSQL